MKNLKFRQRKETKYLYLVFKDVNGMSFDEHYRKQLCKGELDTGYHFYINTDGMASKDRQFEAIAGWDFEENERAIYIFVDAKNGRMNDSQFYEVNRLTNQVKEEYPQIQVVQVNK